MSLNLTRRRDGQAFSEPIEMKERRYGFSPKVFWWHGHCYRVDSVERCWTRAARHRRNGGQLCFLVRCAEERFVVYQDLAANTWHLSGARCCERKKALLSRGRLWGRERKVRHEMGTALVRR